MKKILFLSLFSTTILLGTAGVTASAEEATTDSSPAVEIPSDPVVPSEPTSTTPSVEPPTDPVVPPASGGESQPTVPDTPEVPVTPPSEPSGGETVPTTPTDPGTSTIETPGSTTDSSTTEQPTTPSISEEPEQPTEEPTQPSEEQPTEKPKEDKATKPKEDKPADPAKEIKVSVDTSGKITTGAAQGTSVPIVTSDVKEISHVPTPTTPLKAASGQTIVGVKDGVPLVQDAQGNLVEDPSIPVKKLPSGNIEVKAADGKTKVLPKTGEEVQAALSLLGVLLTSVAGFFGYKKKCKG